MYQMQKSTLNMENGGCGGDVAAVTGGIIRRSTVGAFASGRTGDNVVTKISLTAGLGKKMWKSHTTIGHYYW